MRNLDAVSLIKEAKQVLRKRGWFQGGMQASPDGPCCLLHAIQVSAGMRISLGDIEPELPVDIAYQTLLKVTGSEMNRLGRWNDTAGRTVEQVMGALDSAIKELS